MQLSDQQKNAVEYIGSPTLVIAGAGSGKTRTLTAKIAYLISIGYDPKRILAITFTNKAAEEMKKRLVSMTNLSSKNYPWVRTYHSACFKIIKKHCLLLGYKNPIQIYTPYHQQKIMKDICIKHNLDKKLVKVVLSLISKAKNSGFPLQFIDNNSFAHTIGLNGIYNDYQQVLKTKNAVDFDSILLLTRNLLFEHKDICKYYQDFYQYVLCDEYQDTNDLNEEITRLLVKDGNLFVVGDDWQSIYSFRMSNINHVLNFEKRYKSAKVFRLEQNFRCADKIVQVANDLIDYNEHKIHKKCFSTKKGGIVKIHEFYDESREADWVAGKIKSLHEMGISYDKIAVLYRTKFCSLGFEKALRNFKIPYKFLGGKGFFERKEVLDINSYIISSVFQKDDSSFGRIINIPKRGIGPKTIKKIEQLKTCDMGLQDAARMAVDKKTISPKVGKLLTLLIDLLDDIKDMKPDLAIKKVLEKVDYFEYLNQYTKSESKDFISRKENIEQLIYSASVYETIVDYLEDAALINEDKGNEDENSEINLSTIHAAKGLEYQVVFVVACEEQLFPHWRSLESEFGIEEERRLMYVSTTRSEQYLFFSFAQYRRGQYNIRSRFLDEISEFLYS